MKAPAPEPTPCEVLSRDLAKDENFAPLHAVNRLVQETEFLANHLEDLVREAEERKMSELADLHRTALNELRAMKDNVGRICWCFGEMIDEDYSRQPIKQALTPARAHVAFTSVPGYANTYAPDGKTAGQTLAEAGTTMREAIALFKKHMHFNSSYHNNFCDAFEAALPTIDTISEQAAGIIKTLPKGVGKAP